MSAIKDLPVILAGHRLSVVELPCPKTRRGRASLVVTDRDGATQFVVALFMKLRPQPGQRAPKGEEVRVTLETDPGRGVRGGHAGGAGEPAGVAPIRCGPRTVGSCRGCR